jgi:tetratricopeptide (TPR) repeat protein
MRKLPFLFFLLILNSGVILKAQDDKNYLAGEKAYASGNYALALDNYSRYIKTFEDKVPEYLSKMHAYDTSSAFVKASMYSGFTANREWAVGYYKRGMANLKNNNVEPASNDFDMAIKIDAKYADPYLQKGLLLRSKGRNTACAYIGKAHWLDESNAAAKQAFSDNFCWMCGNEYFTKGKTEVELKQFSTGLQNLNLAITYCHDSANYYTYRGIAFEGLGKLDSAIADYAFAIKHDSGNYMAYYRRAMTYEQAQKYKEAFDDLNKAILISPKFANAYKHQAADCENLNMPQAALYDYQQLLRLAPNEGIAWYKIGLRKKELGQDACDYFQKALDLGIDDAQSYADDCAKEAARKALK